MPCDPAAWKVLYEYHKSFFICLGSFYEYRILAWYVLNALDHFFCLGGKNSDKNLFMSRERKTDINISVLWLKAQSQQGLNFQSFV